jgi:hypothetical protein
MDGSMSEYDCNGSDSDHWMNACRRQYDNHRQAG